MSFKKNAFSYFIWILFAMCNFAVFSFLSILCAKMLKGPVLVTALGMGAAFFVLLSGIYLLTGFCMQKANEAKKSSDDDIQIKKRIIWEGIVAVCILAAGAGLRIYLLPSAGETAAYFDIAKVTQDSASMMVPVQNSIYYYLCLLRGMFTVIGNQWIAGIWLQIILQGIASVVIYFVIRKMAGVLTAMAVLAYLMFAPSSVRGSLVYGPDILYFLIFALGLGTVVLYLSGNHKDFNRKSLQYSVFMWLLSVPVGFFAGFLSYVDISGMVLLVPILFLPGLLKENKKIWVLLGRMVLTVLSAVGGFVISLYLDGLLSGAGFLRVWSAWAATYQPEMPDVIVLMQNSTVEVMVLLVLLSVNLFSFFRKKDRDIVTVWIVMLFAMAAFYVFGVTTAGMSGRYLLLTIMCVGAAIGVRELFRVMPQKEIARNDEVQEVLSEPAENKDNKPRFLDNPLPLPKKHVKRTMDYAFVPENAQMKYDVEVSESDDFDV